MPCTFQGGLQHAVHAEASLLPSSKFIIYVHVKRHWA